MAPTYAVPGLIIISAIAGLLKSELLNFFRPSFVAKTSAY